MEPTTGNIHARSRQQALDWSLVLLSQGIESTVDFTEAGWELFVPEEARVGALQAIHQYQLENQRWPWRQEIPQAGLLFDWASLAWVLLLVFFYWLSAGSHDLQTLGVMNSARVGQGQWWRLFTAVWLHADLGHLAGNATLGLVLLGLTLGRYGTGTGLLAAYLAGVGGNCFDWLLSFQPRASLGASGMVMGSLGLLAAHTLSSWRQAPHSPRAVVSGIFGGLMLFVLLGLAPDSDIQAHFGGFLSGLVLGFVAVLLPKLRQSTSLNLVSGLGFLLLVLWPWWMALRAW